MSGHGPIEDPVRGTMQRIGGIIGQALPESYGFALLVFGLGSEGRMNYISNAQRGDMILALRELLENFERQETK